MISTIRDDGVFHGSLWSLMLCDVEAWSTWEGLVSGRQQPRKYIEVFSHENQAEKDSYVCTRITTNVGLINIEIEEES